MTEEGNKAEIPYVSAQDKIALRNSWLKICVVSVLTVLLSYKLAVTDFSKIFENFEFSDLLSLLLALFSIALSVLFYLKATETSNVFYDNTYRFTKDVSEILGRVEAGFGERLKHLDEGYTGLKSAVENIPFDKKEVEKEIQEEEQHLKKAELDRLETIERFVKKAELQDDEKKEFIKRLKEQDEELATARKELDFLKIKLGVERGKNRGFSLNFTPVFRRNIKKYILSMLGDDIQNGASDLYLKKKFSKIMKSLPLHIKHDLDGYGFIKADGELNDLGLTALKNIHEYYT